VIVLPTDVSHWMVKIAAQSLQGRHALSILA